MRDQLTVGLAEIPKQNTPDYTRIHNLVHPDQSSPNSIGNEAYGNNIDPRLEQVGVGPNYARNYNPGNVGDNFPNHAGIDVDHDEIDADHDGIDDFYDNIDPLHEQENIPPDSPNFHYHYRYGTVIIPRQIAPLHQSLLNSARTVSPLLAQREMFPLQESQGNAYFLPQDQRMENQLMQDLLYDPYEFPWDQYSNYPVSPLLERASNDRNHSESGKRMRIWEDDDDEDDAAYTARPRKIARRESPKIKIEPADDE